MNALVPVTVPPGVVIATFCAPAVPVAVVAVIVVAVAVIPVAATPPMVTEVAPVRLVPVIVTLVPPATGPEAGLILLKVGAGTGAVTFATVKLSKRTALITEEPEGLSIDTSKLVKPVKGKPLHE